MTQTRRLTCFLLLGLWLVVTTSASTASLALNSGPVAPLSLTDSISPSTIRYDGTNLESITYDSAVFPLRVYDHGLVRFEGEGNFSPAGEGISFIGFAEFLAAEEGQMLFRGVPGNGTQKAILGQQGIAMALLRNSN